MIPEIDLKPERKNYEPEMISAIPVRPVSPRMLIPSGIAQAQEKIPAASVKGLVAVADLGIGSCIPCKMMGQIL